MGTARVNSSKFKEFLDASELLFVEHYAVHGDITRAGAHAGKTTQQAKTIFQRPQVKRALLEARTKVMKKVEYNVEAAMNEAQDAIDFARATENANAYVKAVELRSKLSGLLVDKIDLRQTIGFSVQIVGIGTPQQIEAKVIPQILPPQIPHVEMEPVVEDDPFSGEATEDNPWD